MFRYPRKLNKLARKGKVLKVKIPKTKTTPKEQHTHIVQIAEKLRRLRNSQKHELPEEEFKRWEHAFYRPRTISVHIKERELRAILVGDEREKARKDNLDSIDLEDCFE